MFNTNSYIMTTNDIHCNLESIKFELWQYFGRNTAAAAAAIRLKPLSKHLFFSEGRNPTCDETSSHVFPSFCYCSLTLVLLHHMISQSSLPQVGEITGVLVDVAVVTEDNKWPPCGSAVSTMTLPVRPRCVRFPEIVAFSLCLSPCRLDLACDCST